MASPWPFSPLTGLIHIGQGITVGILTAAKYAYSNYDSVTGEIASGLFIIINKYNI